MISAAAFPRRVVIAVCLIVGLAATAAGQGVTTSSSRYWKVVEDALGRKGTANPGNVLKFGFPRNDLAVVLDGVTLKPALALGSWVAFQRIGDHAMAMGDLVLLEDEVESVMASLQQNGIEQTALHNHLVGELPHVMYMHIRAIGNPGRIARAVRMALEFTKTPLEQATAAPAAALDLDTTSIVRIIGVRGKVNAGVYQLSIPRREKIRHDKMEIPAAMGVATAINFQSTGAGKAAITGDFVLLGREVNSVIWALSEAGIKVTALHSHMIGEDPRLFFMHFWAIDDVPKLARGLRAALDRTGPRR
ncbi:MAG: DUF1259 domain-containing protein [Armatimonadetes bacterium]|nr:DUF1259 domain-containing protein [Armatimonadota bacterium]